MIRDNKFFAIVIIGLFFTILSCHARPSSEQISSGDYGPYPSDYRSIVIEHKAYYYSGNAFTPIDKESFKFRTLTKGYISKFSKISYGWLACGTFSTRGLLGTNDIPFIVLVNGDKVVAEQDIMPNQIFKWPCPK